MENKNIIFLDCSKKDIVFDSVDKKYNDYTLEECVIIRTTDVFPFDKIIQTPSNGNAYGFGISSIMDDAITKKKQEINYKNFNDNELLLKELKKYEVCHEILRTTIHFTINGLVGSHAYRNFEGRPYIIIEPLKYHIKDESLLSLSVEDTYFNSDMALSEEVAIIIKEDKFNEIKDNPEYISTLEKFKVYVYRGSNEKAAVQQTLHHLGYDSFIVNNHGYVNGWETDAAANKMCDFIGKLGDEFSKSKIKHFGSPLYMMENINISKKAKIIDTELFIYIINNSTTITQEEKNKILMTLKKDTTQTEQLRALQINFSFPEEQLYNVPANLKDIMSEIIEKITLKEIAKLTKEFNEIYINRLKSINGHARK